MCVCVPVCVLYVLRVCVVHVCVVRVVCGSSTLEKGLCEWGWKP